MPCCCLGFFVFLFLFLFFVVVVVVCTLEGKVPLHSFLCVLSAIFVERTVLPTLNSPTKPAKKYLTLFVKPGGPGSDSTILFGLP